MKLPRNRKNGIALLYMAVLMAIIVEICGVPLVTFERIRRTYATPPPFTFIAENFRLQFHWPLIPLLLVTVGAVALLCRRKEI